MNPYPLIYRHFDILIVNDFVCYSYRQLYFYYMIHYRPCSKKKPPIGGFAQFDHIVGMQKKNQDVYLVVGVGLKAARFSIGDSV